MESRIEQLDGRRERELEKQLEGLKELNYHLQREAKKAAIAGWFLVGRVVFSVGYFLGGLLKMEFMRSPGMACNFILVYLLIEAIYIPGGPLIPFLLGV